MICLSSLHSQIPGRDAHVKLQWLCGYCLYTYKFVYQKHMQCNRYFSRSLNHELEFIHKVLVPSVCGSCVTLIVDLYIDVV
jgi:hypothetical protein